MLFLLYNKKRQCNARHIALCMKQVAKENHNSFIRRRVRVKPLALVDRDGRHKPRGTARWKVVLLFVE
jgi:hypothetical protein